MRNHVINKRGKVNMSDVENMALILSKSSKSVADLKARYPNLQENISQRHSTTIKFLKEEPERLETALRRCKKLTGTLVTLKRLASVQEQRLPPSQDPRESPTPGEPVSTIANSAEVQAPKSNRNLTSNSTAPGSQFTNSYTVSSPPPNSSCPQNALDALLNELANPNQIYATAADLQQIQQITQPPPPQKNRLYPEPPKRLPSYPSTESGGSPVRNYSSWTNQQSIESTGTNSPQRVHHPPLPPKPNKVPPPPPPRVSSKSPNLLSPNLKSSNLLSPSIESSESSESINSQETGGGSNKQPHHHLLSQRHQDLIKKQRQLQDQYDRLKLLATTNNGTETIKKELKKTGSESNIQSKLKFSSAPTGSLTNINKPNTLYETDIL